VRLFRNAFLVAAVGYLAVCAAMWAFQERLIFLPRPATATTPTDLGLEYEELELVTTDGLRLPAWLVEPGGAETAVLVCHGNAGSIDSGLHHARAFARWGHATLLFAYRGYGANPGRPTEEGTYLDAEAAYEALLDAGFEPARIAVYGQSLGGAVAIELAVRREVGALVTESTFTSMADMGARLYPWLPARRLTRVHYDNAAKIGGLRTPWLSIHSPEDDLVPFSQAEQLFALAPEPKERLATRGGHNDGGFLGTDTEHVVADFLSRHLGDTSGE